MDTIAQITKEAMIYSTMLLAGGLFLLKRIFKRRKIDKNFFDKTKKKIVRKAKLFFSDLSKGIEIKSQNNKEDQNLNCKDYKYLKMKKFIENLPNTSKQNDKNCPQDQHISNNKKDQIFYYLLNNISQMMIQTKQETY